MLELEPANLETAEERAKRIWRNQQIIRQMRQLQAIDEQPTAQNDKILLKTLALFKKEVRKIILTSQTDIIQKYLLLIQSRKRQLLKEKLRRLERNDV